MGYIRRIFTFCLMFSMHREIYVTKYCDDNKRILADNEQLLYLLLQYSLYILTYMSRIRIGAYNSAKWLCSFMYGNDDDGNDDFAMTLDKYFEYLQYWQGNPLNCVVICLDIRNIKYKSVHNIFFLYLSLSHTLSLYWPWMYKLMSMYLWLFNRIC